VSAGRPAVLAEILGVRGVLAVALVDASGEVCAHDAREGLGFADAGPLVASALAASRVLGDFMGGELRQSVIEYRGAPLVLTPLPSAPGPDDPTPAGMVLALRLASIADLGRLRVRLPRLLAQCANAT
jgi:hypothetical protein